MLTEDDQLDTDSSDEANLQSTSPAETTQPGTASQTVSSSSPATPFSPAISAAVAMLVISLQPRTGVRNLRGKPTTIPTGHLDIMVDGKQRAWTRTEKGTPIRALAEFLPHEIPQLQAAVVAYRGDDSPPIFRSLPKGTPEEIDKLKKM
jgi:hypothetical protein